MSCIVNKPVEHIHGWQQKKNYTRCYTLPFNVMVCVSCIMCVRFYVFLLLQIHYKVKIFGRIHKLSVQRFDD